MFSFFKIKLPHTCPVSEESRISLEDNFLLLLKLFGRENTMNRKVMIPHYSDFPVKYDHSESSAFDTLKIVAHQMEVAFDDIWLEFYTERIKELRTGSPLWQVIYLRSERDENGASGLYWAKMRMENMISRW